MSYENTDLPRWFKELLRNPKELFPAILEFFGKNEIKVATKMPGMPGMWRVDVLSVAKADSGEMMIGPPKVTIFRNDQVVGGPSDMTSAIPILNLWQAGFSSIAQDPTDAEVEVWFRNHLGVVTSKKFSTPIIGLI